MDSELCERAQAILREFEQAWSFDTRDLERTPADQLLHELVDQSAAPLRQRLDEEFFALGPIGALTTDPNVQEIIVNGAREILFEKDGALHRLADRFLTPGTFKNFIDRLCGEAGLKVDLSAPFTDGRWRGFRVHLGCAPLTHCDFHLTLRRVPDNPWTLAQLAEANWCTNVQLEKLRSLIRVRSNLLFIGPTGCGKTTVLGACLKELPANERVVIVEDTDELPRPNAASTKLLSRAESSGELPEIQLSHLVRQSLRMRPQRLVMGEVRGGEAKDLLLALATGHSGSLGTLHASEARQALLRLEMLVQLGAPQWNVQAIRQLIQLSVDGLVVCGYEGGHRRLFGIYKVAALESFGFLLEPLA